MGGAASRRRVGALVCLLLLAVAACASTVAGRPTEPALADLVVPFAGSAQPDNGAFTLDKYVGKFANAPDIERPLLQDAGFRAGYLRQTHTASETLAVYLFELRDPASAQRVAAAYGATPSVVPVDTSGIRGATGFVSTRSVEGDDPFDFAEVVFTAGRIACVTQISGSGDRHELGVRTVELATRQARQLGVPKG